MPGLSGRVGRLLPRSFQKPLKDLRSRIRFALHPLELMLHAPVAFGAYRYLATHPDVERRSGGWVYRDRFYPDYLTKGAASGAILREARSSAR